MAPPLFHNYKRKGPIRVRFYQFTDSGSVIEINNKHDIGNGVTCRKPFLGGNPFVLVSLGFEFDLSLC